MTAQARIVDQPYADSIGIYLIRDGAGARALTRPNHPDGDYLITPGEDPGVSLRLDDDMAVALLDALARHYRRATDTGTLRADYEAERARVDLLTRALIDAHAATLRTSP